MNELHKKLATAILNQREDSVHGN